MPRSYADAVAEGCYLCGTHDFNGRLAVLDLKVFNGRPKRYEREYILCDDCAKKFHRILNAVKTIRSGE